MSSVQAIAGVTAALRDFLLPRVQSVVPNSDVTMKPPGDLKDLGQTRSLVNLFLFTVLPDPSYRNTELGPRKVNSSADPSKNQWVVGPRTALDLRYIISFYGDDTDQALQKLLGTVIAWLHDQPALTVADPGNPNETFSVRFNIMPVSAEDLSRLWAAFSTQTPYMLSLAYEASVVYLETQSALPLPDVDEVELEVGVKEDLDHLLAPDLVFIKATNGN